MSIRERLGYWMEDVRYTFGSRWRAMNALHGWLCHRGIHSLEWDGHVGMDPWLLEPGEPGWECAYCLASGYPARFAISDWLWAHAPLRWVAEWQQGRMAEE